MRTSPEQAIAATEAETMSLRKAAVYLDISYRWMQRLIADREIEFIRYGSLRKRVTKAACDRWLRERTVAPRRRG